jgi:hypothetical protein
MVSPINYILDVKDPIEQAMLGYTTGRKDIEQRQIMGVREQQEGRDQEKFAIAKQDREAARANAARQRAQAEASQKALADLAAQGLNATYQDFVKAWVANPAIRTDLDKLQTILKQPQITALINANQSIYSAASTNNPEVVARLLEEQITVAQSPGGDPSIVPSLQFSLDALNENPESIAQIKVTTGLTLLSLTSPEHMKQIDEWLGVGGGGDLPAEVRELQFRADAAGLVPGTPEYQNFMLTGGAVAPVKKSGFRAATPEELVKFGSPFGQIDQDDGRFYPINVPKGMRLTVDKDGNVSFTEGDVAGASKTGKTTTDYVYTTDPKTGEQIARPIAGTPAALEVQKKRSKLEANSDTARNMLATIESVVGRPAGNGLTAIEANPALPGILGFVEGLLPAKTQAQADLMAKYKQINGRAFLEAFETLKNGGQITEIEGLKATQALARLDRTQSPEAFKESLYEFADIVRQGLARAQKELATIPEIAPAPAPSAATQPAANIPQSFLTNSKVIELTNRLGITPEAIWNKLSPEAKANYGN